MASRVNTRFVAFLAIGLMLLGGGAMVAVYFSLKKSGADYAALGDKFMTEANYERAAEYYSKAVFKKRTNAEWIDKWLKAMQKTTPTPRSVYLDRYMGEYLPALKAYSDALPEDVGAQKRFLDEAYLRMKMFPAPMAGPWDQFITEVNACIARFPDPEGPARELRRYRGLANIFKTLIATPDKQKELLQSIESDLTAALAANPKDEEAAAELANVKMLRSVEAKAAREAESAKRLEKEAVEGLDSFAKANGASARVLWRQLQVEFWRAAQVAEDTGVPLTRKQLYEDKHDKFVAVINQMKAEPGEKLDFTVLSQVCTEGVRAEKIGNAGVLDLLYALEQKAPDKIYVKMLAGRFEVMSKHYDKAGTAYQRVIDAPDLPLSFEGYVLFEQRAEAYKQQIMSRLAMREEILAKIAAKAPGVGTPEEARKALDEARVIRGRLAEYVGDAERVLLYVDARLAYAEGNFEAARVNLDRYNERSGEQDVGALVLYASIMDKMGNTGLAREYYAKSLQRDPQNLLALAEFAELEQRAQRYTEALKLIEELRKLLPANQDIEERYSRIKLLAEVKATDDPTKVADASLRAKLEIQNLISGVNPDYEAAIKKAQDALEATRDVELYPLLARLQQAAGRSDDATATIKEGLKAAPGNPTLVAMQRILEIKDPMEAMLQALNEDQRSTPFQKQVWRALVYSQFDRKAEAKAALAEAAKLEPDHPDVIEMSFRLALSENNMAEAKRLADVAATRNADNVEGLTYKAQLEIAEKRVADAIASLEAALEKDRNSVRVWRYLGALRLDTRNPELAATAFERALAIRPQDIDSIKGLLRARIQLGQRDRALELAREKKDFAVSDMDFVDLWLELEAVAAGGDRGRALELRRELAKRNPKSERNNSAMVLLLLNEQKFAEARAIIDRLRAEGDSPAYVELDIRWHTAQGNIREASEVFNRWVTSLTPEKHTEQPYVALAGVFVDYNRYDAALVALDGGRKHQDPKTMGADRKLGELQFIMQRYPQSVDTYERVLAADPNDPEYKINGQLVEANIRMRKFAEAKRRLDALGAGIDANPRMLLLKGETLAGLQQPEEASRTYDTAVSLAKDDPIGYIKRAEFLVKDPRRQGDAEQDLRQALSLAPRHVGARVALARLYINRDDRAKAVEVMSQGLQADPDNDSLRWDLVGLHLRYKQEIEAIRLVEEALTRRKEDPTWLFRGREVMYALNRFDDAANYAWRLWERKKDADAALAYLDAVTKVKTPDYVKAMQVLGTPELKTQSDMRLLLARARIQLKRQRLQEAMADIRAAIGGTNPNDFQLVRALFAGLTVVYESPKDRLAALNSLRPQNGYPAWMGFFYSNLKTSFPETRDEGLSELRTLAETATDVTLRTQTYAVIGSRWRAEKNYVEAINWWKKGLEVDPADAELNNNVAYCSSEDLGKPADGLPYAEKAARSAPNNPSVQDTLGTVYLRLGQAENAEQAFVRGLGLAGAADEAIPLLLHLGELRITQGNKTEAETFIRRAEELMKADPEMKQQYEAHCKELLAKLGSN